MLFYSRRAVVFGLNHSISFHSVPARKQSISFMVPFSWEEEFLHRPRFAHAHGVAFGAEGRNGSSLPPFGCLLNMLCFPFRNGNSIFSLIIKVTHVYCEKSGNTEVQRPKVTQKNITANTPGISFQTLLQTQLQGTRTEYSAVCSHILFTHLASLAHSRWLCIILLYGI